MKFTLPVEQVKPYIFRKLEDVHERLSASEKIIVQDMQAYHRKLHRHENANALLRLFIHKPLHPREDSMTSIPWDIKSEIERERVRVRNALYHIKGLSTITLEESDMEYYGIDLTEIN